ncbi:MAG: hypothetical protein ACOH2J_04750 [Allorhizobium sp.]
MLLAPYSISVDTDNISGSCFRQPVFKAGFQTAMHPPFDRPAGWSKRNAEFSSFFPNGYLQVPIFLFISRLTNDARHTAARQIGE